MKNRFYLLAYPSETVLAEVRELKKQLAGIIERTPSSLGSPGHLSVSGFTLTAGKETILITQLGLIFKSIQPFTLQLSGLLYFSSTSTLFLEYADPDSFLQIQKAIVGSIKDCLPALKRSMSIASVPHMTLARGISPQESDEVIRHLSPLNCSGSHSFSKFSLMIELEGKMREMHSWFLK